MASKIIGEIRHAQGHIGCSVSEMYGITSYDDPEQLLKEYAPLYLDKYRGQFVIFSDKTDSRVGYKVEEYVNGHGLGDVWCSPEAPNPNHGQSPPHLNVIWVWTVNIPALTEWRAKNAPPPPPTQQMNYH